MCVCFCKPFHIPTLLSSVLIHYMPFSITEVKITVPQCLNCLAEWIQYGFRVSLQTENCNTVCTTNLLNLGEWIMFQYSFNRTET